MWLCDNDVGPFLQAALLCVRLGVSDPFSRRSAGVRVETSPARRGSSVFASSVSHSHVKLSDPLVLAFGFFSCLNVAGSAAAMAGVEVQGKNLTQRPELYHRTIHIFKAHSVRALNYFSPVIFGWVTLLSAPRTSRTPSFPNENYFKPFRSQK